MTERERLQQRTRNTVNLPRTTFPMRANLPVNESGILRYWEEIGLYRLALARTAGHTPFVLHDGPPFSNGSIHLGHALNKVLKDIILKFRSMQGYATPFVPGWDTHGLPTEIQALRTLDMNRHGADLLDVRRRCASTARKYSNLQRTQFKRLGIRGDWAGAYLTMQPAYEAAVLDVFRQLVEAGLIYRGLKPVHWCPECETALAEAEVEYLEHEAPSAYIAFPAVHMLKALFKGEDRARMSAVIWTTTPWTLPANVAIAVHPDTCYALVTDDADREGFTYLVARRRADDFARVVGMKRLRVLGEVLGRQLDGAVFLHPLFDRESPVVLAEYVNTESGTGLVHLAPGHGEEDFLTGMTYGLPVIQPISPSGIFGSEAGPYAGQPIYEAQMAMLGQMDRDGTLLAYDTILHQYPHCWRCRQPVLSRATPQWFIALQHIIARAPEVIDRVTWTPAWGRERMCSMVASRPDWCISRQRVWGTPIPAVYCTACDEPLLSPAIITRAADIVREEGSDAWFIRPVEDFVPEGTACMCCGGHAFRKETDIFDVWFDSGCSHLAVLEERPELSWPAELYLEGHDQYRGWFQASLLTSLGLSRAEAPYRAVLTHGFIVDQQGRKQSKSIGNITDPMQIVDQYGADILRLWVASVDTRADVAVAEDIITQVRETYRRLRNFWRFLLGNLYDFSPDHLLRIAKLSEMDRWALHQLNALIHQVTSAFEEYAFHRVYHLVNAYCAQMSSVYLDIAKDRLYTLLPDDPRRRAIQTVLYYHAVTLTQLLAPVLSFTAEEVWQLLPGEKRAPSVQLTAWPTPQTAWTDAALATKWMQVLAVREVAMTALQVARTHRRISQPLAAKVFLYLAGKTRELMESLEDTLAQVLMVSAVGIAPLEEAPADAYRGGLPEVAVLVTQEPGVQCPRCRWWRAVGSHPSYPDLCAPCAVTVDALTSRHRGSDQAA